MIFTNYFRLINIVLVCILSSPTLANTYHYDKLNRLTQVTYPSGDSLHYSYDAAGNLLAVNSIVETEIYSIQGKIEQAYTYQPLSGVLVTLGSTLSTTTDENGYFTFSNVATGEYTLSANLDGYYFANQTISVSENIATNLVGISQDTACVLYAVHDEERRDSQFFTISSDFKVTLIGNLHLGKDIEALDIHPITAKIYVGSGHDGEQPGWLYTINAHDGELNLIGSTGFNNISGLSFTSDGQLWGWAKGEGLIKIDTATGVGDLVIAYTGNVEDMRWNHSNDVLYLVQNSNFYAYSMLTQTIEPIGCYIPEGEIEAIEIIQSGELLFTIHNDTELLIYALDLDSCEILSAYTTNEPQNIILNDVEGMAWPANVCQ